jgi:hypothetical protein
MMPMNTRMKKVVNVSDGMGIEGVHKHDLLPSCQAFVDA